MIISIDDNFTDLYNILKDKGYEVHRFSENTEGDVIIYSGQNTGLAFVNSMAAPGSEMGTFLIDGDNISIEEAQEMIKNKTYSSIF